MTVDKGKGEIPGQESFTFPPSEKPNVTKLIEEAQGLGILSETSQIELPQGATNKIDMGEGFSLRRSTSGLIIENSWTKGRIAVSLVPIALQIVSGETTDQKWQLIFVPFARTSTTVMIPFANSLDIKAINVALPLEEWPPERTDEVSDLIIRSREELVYPHTYPTKVPDYKLETDIWNNYLRLRESALPEQVRSAIEKTPSSKQIQYLAQHAGT